MIGILAAMNSEVEAIKTVMDIKKIEETHPMTWIYGTISGKDVILTKCGVGKALAAMSTALLCNKEKIEALINVGVAGGLKNEQHVQDIVISSKVIQADYDTSALDGKAGKGLVFDADSSLQEAAIRAANQLQYPYHVGAIASQDLFMAREEDFHKLMTDYPESVCSEMEAGAIGQVAKTFDIPFLVIRSLSDVVCHSDNPMEFSQYCAIASKKAAAWIEAMLKTM